MKWTEEEDLNHDERIRWAMEIIYMQLEDKSFK